MIRVICIIIFFLLASCTSDYDTISEEKMIDIIVDMHLADQVIRKYNPIDQDSIREELSKALLKVHNVSQEQLDTNLYIYQYDITSYKDLTLKVVERLDSLQAQIERRSGEQ